MNSHSALVASLHIQHRWAINRIAQLEADLARTREERDSLLATVASLTEQCQGAAACSLAEAEAAQRAAGCKPIAW